jgi:hypothetical protein
MVNEVIVFFVLISKIWFSHKCFVFASENNFLNKININVKIDK